MEQLLSRLNPQQRQAAETIDGPLLIIAGAGSGKTGVITTRIAHMVTRGISPSSILAMTFTNKAAGEMKDRVKEMLAGLEVEGIVPGTEPAMSAKAAATDLTISTFHAFGLAMLRRYGRQLGYRPNFTVYDTGDQVALLKEAAR